MMDGWTMTGWGWAWMSISMVIGVLLVALIVFALLRGPASGSLPQEPLDPEQILAQRLARGEIDEAEYQRRRRVLRDQPSVS